MSLHAQGVHHAGPLPKLSVMLLNDTPTVQATRPSHASLVGTATLNVQHIFDDEAPETGDERAYVGVRCLACSGIHLVSRTTGRLVSDKADE